jgi:betaine-aldehyde dehydrogenase
MRSYEHWIAGVPVSGAGITIQRRSPAHGRLLAEFRAGTKADINAAVGVARRAFELPSGWPRMPAMERAAARHARPGLSLASCNVTDYINGSFAG